MNTLVSFIMKYLGGKVVKRWWRRYTNKKVPEIRLTGPQSFSSKTAVVELLEDGRSVRMYHDLSYTDSEGKVWTVPKGDISNGATITRFFWRIIGSPLTGYYRLPSLFHDYLCKQTHYNWRTIHALYYEMCVVCGVSKWKA